jgi:RNA polymerase I-specific transcription initiation factor RRN3
MPRFPNPPPCAGQLGQLWHTLLGAFERSLLHTHRSKFTQYLLFRACAEDPRRCCAGFVKVLLARLRDARQAPITRAAAAAYLASFLARCALAPEALVVEVLQQLAAACGEYADGAGGGGSGGGSGSGGSAGRPGGVLTLASAGSSGALGAMAGGGGGGGGGDGAARHQVFYAMVQALLYVLCYHMEPLVHQQHQHPGASPAHAAAVKALVRERVVLLLGHARLQPLAVCLPSVSAEFVRQAAALKLADLGPLLAAAAPGGAPAAAPPAAAAAGDAGAAPPLARPSVRPLEMFFPFDPYLLRRSSRFLALETNYVRWRGGHPHAAAAADDGAPEGASDDADALSEDGGDEEGAGAAGSSSGGGSGSGSEELSSSELEDEEDHHMAASLDGPAGLTPPGLAAAGAAAGRGGVGAAAAALAHRAASIGRLRPVGVAAAAAGRQAALGLSASGPSPDPMLMGASLISSGGLPDSYGGARGPSPAGPGGFAFRGGGLSPASPGGGTPLGVSPAPMSYTPYDSYMQSIPARLGNTHA